MSRTPLIDTGAACGYETIRNSRFYAAGAADHEKAILVAIQSEFANLLSLGAALGQDPIDICAKAMRSHALVLRFGGPPSQDGYLDPIHASPRSLAEDQAQSTQLFEAMVAKHHSQDSARLDAFLTARADARKNAKPTEEI